MNLFQEICITGDHYSLGYQHGQLLKNDIKTFLADNFAHINLLSTKKLLKEDIFKLVNKHKIIIEQDTPSIAEELYGLAEGADISYEEAILLQMRREIIDYSSSVSHGECTLVAKFEKGVGGIIAQTVDLNGNMLSLGNIFRIKSLNKNIPEILMYSFSGLLGYLGLNSAGVGIGINFVLSRPWSFGLSPYLLVRHLLQMRSLKECLMELKRIRRASSRSFTICDSTHLAIIEMTVDDIRIIRGKKLCRTNHFLHNDFQKEDKINIFSRNASIQRLQIVKDLMVLNRWSMKPEKLFKIFSDHSLYPVGLCVHSEGNIHREDTVASVVLYPNSKTMFIRKGYPCSALTQSFLIS